MNKITKTFAVALMMIGFSSVSAAENLAGVIGPNNVIAPQVMQLAPSSAITPQEMKLAPVNRFGVPTLVGSSSSGFQCTGLHCSCTGDVDCNDMFSTNVCGDIAQCYEESDGSVNCECLRL